MLTPNQTKIGASDTEPVMCLRPSRIRKGFGIGALIMLGTVLIYVALTAHGSVASTAALALAAAGSYFVSWRMWKATLVGLELRRYGLHTTNGELVAAFDNVRQIERGMFAFKPSNGFLIVLREPMTRSWNPGLWWRLGRRVGVGGVTPRAEGKVMAETMALLIDQQQKLSNHGKGS